MSEAQALIDDIAAEYPDLRSDAELLQLDQGTGAGDGDGDAEGDADGGPQPGDMAGLTDEALRQFANAAAMHYELHQGEREGEGVGQEGEGKHQQEEEYGDASLAQVVSGSIPPPPRPTYETTHRPHPELTLQSSIPSSADAGPPKRKRLSEEYVPTAQPIQAQGPRGKKYRLDSGSGAGMIDPAITEDPSAALSPRAMEGLVPQGMYGRVPPALQPMMAPSSSVAGQGSGRGRKARTHGEEVMGMTDGGGEGSDGGRKENKDERSARRAEQNRRAQQNFRKRREETMKQQEARLKELEPQLEALQRQQAETHLLLEALKLENTALRAVLIHSVKQGARILDPQGELIGPRDIDPSASTAAAAGTTEGSETDKAVDEVYAALDRLGARTHVYARTIASDDPSPLLQRPSDTPLMSGIAQSSMRTVPHGHHPASHPHPQIQQSHLQMHAPSSSAQRTPQHAFPTTNLPPFPGARGDSLAGQPQVEEPDHSSGIGQIDPTLESHAQGDESLMIVDAEEGLTLPE